jgi:hypothetical protein
MKRNGAGAGDFEEIAGGTEALAGYFDAIPI